MRTGARLPRRPCRPTRRRLRRADVPVDDGHVTTIAVDPTWHRHKIGTRLLAAPRSPSRSPRVPGTSPSRCGVSNDGAQALYRRFGFAPAGVRKDYYVETDEDALVMWAHDVDTRRVRRPARRASSAGIPGDHDRGRARVSERRPTPTILGIETSCDETAAAVVVDGTDGAVVGGVEPGRPARPLRRRRARDRQPGPRRAAHAGRRPGAGRGRRRATTTSTPSRPPSARASSARCSSA